MNHTLFFIGLFFTGAAIVLALCKAAANGDRALVGTRSTASPFIKEDGDGVEADPEAELQLEFDPGWLGFFLILFFGLAVLFCNWLIGLWLTLLNLIYPGCAHGVTPGTAAPAVPFDLVGTDSTPSPSSLSIGDAVERVPANLPGKHKSAGKAEEQESPARESGSCSPSAAPPVRRNVSNGQSEQKHRAKAAYLAI